MNMEKHLAQHIREVFFGGNWTSVNLQDVLGTLSYHAATKQVGTCHTIARLVFHIHYYVAAQLRVLQGNELDAQDRFSFDAPAITNEEEWQNMVSRCLSDAMQLSEAVTALHEKKLLDDFTDVRYGSYYRNLQGMVEHTHYHLGQIVILRKMAEELPDT